MEPAADDYKISRLFKKKKVDLTVELGLRPSNWSVKQPVDLAVELDLWLEMVW